MTNDEWDDLVRRRAQQAKSDPRGYRVRVWAWALGGYAILLGTLGLAVACVAGLVLAIFAEAPTFLFFAKPGIAIGVLAFTILRALAVKLPPPSGIELRAADAPALFDTIERLRAQLHAPRVDHVLIDGDFNASIVQVPRFGPLGWERNYLTLGLAYMQTLSREQFTSVLAHGAGATHRDDRHASRALRAARRPRLRRGGARRRRRALAAGAPRRRRAARARRARA
ncbi:MAG: hypothetical protein QOD24_457, partial [Solirubrobacteraceae bacterium]|nr:hypothetical protein [Solirubrobacteraceae bacterium]